MANYQGTILPDVIIGTLGDDDVRGIGVGADAVETLGGDDQIFVDYTGPLLLAPLSTVDGGFGADRLTVNFTGVTDGVTMGPPLLGLVGFSTGFNVLGSTKLAFIGIESLAVTGGAGRDVFYGLAGDDLLIGGGGGDQLLGGAGADRLSGGAGLDSIAGGTGDDVLFGGASSDLLNGGTGSDTADYGDIRAAVQVNLVLGTSAGGGGVDGLVSIENLGGSGFNDVLTGDAGANGLSGRAGNDDLSGGAGDDGVAGGIGDDAISGGDGDDRLYGGAGQDAINGGLGEDTAFYTDLLAGVTVSLAINGAQDTGAGGIDTLMSIENLGGSAFADTLTGDAAANRLRGGDGDDMLAGGAGGDGLYGGYGADRLEGGAGVDSLFGQWGADTFVFSRFSGVDTIADFEAEDVIGLRATSFGLTVGAFDPARLQFGTAATGDVGVFLFDADRRTLYWDSDGAGSAGIERIVVFKGDTPVTADAFMLM